MYAAVWRATALASDPNDRTPITGFMGLMFAARGQLGADRRRNVATELWVIGHAEREIARVGASGPRLQTRHVTALLVDRDDQLRPGAVQLGGQPGQLRPGLYIAGEEDHPAQALGRQAEHPTWCTSAFKAGKDAAEDEGLDLRHPFTAPAVRPPAR